MAERQVATDSKVIMFGGDIRIVYGSDEEGNIVPLVEVPNHDWSTLLHLPLTDQFEVMKRLAGLSPDIPIKVLGLPEK